MIKKCCRCGKNFNTKDSKVNLKEQYIKSCNACFEKAMNETDNILKQVKKEFTL